MTLSYLPRLTLATAPPTLAKPTTAPAATVSASFYKLLFISLLSLALSLSTTFHCRAQGSGQVAGQLLDAQHRPVAFATVLLRQVRDTTWVRDALASAEGRYTFRGLPAGQYQILVENALKHNSGDEDDPLLLSLHVQPDQLRAHNLQRPKRTRAESGGTGLRNLQERYRLLASQPVQIDSSAADFVVTVPLLRQKQ